MVRPSQLLHPQREPVPPRPAATVLLLRDAEDGVEVLMTRRSATASFAPGAYVFPGGAHRRCRRARPRHRRPPAPPGRPAPDPGHRRHPRKLRGTGRPAGPPCGWPARRCAGTSPRMDRASRRLRRAVPRPRPGTGRRPGLRASPTGSPTATCRGASTCPSWSRACPRARSRWPTKPSSSSRCWVRPADALARHAAGSFFMIFPTIRTLERLARFDIGAMRCSQACAGGQPLWTSCPRAGLLKGAEARYMEHEMAYGELALVSPDGQIVHHLDWRRDQPVPLLKNVMRLTAPNPGAMTGPGTNSYLVGDPATGYIAIDPGPNEPEHLERLWRAAGGDIRMIVCTHSHPDHSPGRPAAAGPVLRQAAHPGPALGADRACRQRVHARSRAGRWRSELAARRRRAAPHPESRSTPRATPPTTCAWCCWKTACCSPATTSSTAAPPWSTRRMAT